MPGATLDTGALIAIGRGDRRMQALLDGAHLAAAGLAIPAGVLAQAWRRTPRQARLARLLTLLDVMVASLDEPTAKAAGVLCGRAGTADVVDASVVLAGRLNRQTIVTSDPDDLRRIDPNLELATIRRRSKPLVSEGDSSTR